LISKIKAALISIVLIIVLAISFAGLEHFHSFGDISGTPAENQLSSKDSTVYSELQRNTGSNSTFLKAATQDFLSWGLYGNVSVINPSQDTYRQEPLTKETIDFFSNYSLAIHQLGLPPHNDTDKFLIGNMSQNNPDIVNFNSMTFYGTSDHIDITPDPTREAWSVVEEAKQIQDSGYDLMNHPEMGLGLSTKVITNNWCLFGNPTGIKYYDTDISPSNSKVRDLTKLQWDLYSEFAPINSESKVYSDFTWWDSDNLRKNNPDENDLRISLFNLWQLQPFAFDMNKYDSYIADITNLWKSGKLSNEDFDQMFHDAANNFTVVGLEGAKISLTQSADEFRSIANLYPNGQIQTEYLGRVDPRGNYYGEMADRSVHGMHKTIADFLGGQIESPELWTSEKGWPSLPEWAKNLRGPDHFITANWPSFDLVKFIEGYERENTKTGTEDRGISEITPNVLRAAGFPVSLLGVSPTPPYVGSGEYAVGLPQNVANSLQASFPNVLLGPGCTVSMFSCKDGLKADGVKDAVVTLPFCSERVYLMQNGQ
jgi:hypothetical protein